VLRHISNSNIKLVKQHLLEKIVPDLGELLTVRLWRIWKEYRGMSSTEAESTNPAHAPSSDVADLKSDEDSILNRLGERTEFNNRKNWSLIFNSTILLITTSLLSSTVAREDLNTLYKAFSSHANSNGMLDFVGFQKGWWLFLTTEWDVSFRRLMFRFEWDLLRSEWRTTVLHYVRRGAFEPSSRRSSHHLHIQSNAHVFYATHQT